MKISSLVNDGQRLRPGKTIPGLTVATISSALTRGDLVLVTNPRTDTKMVKEIPTNALIVAKRATLRPIAQNRPPRLAAFAESARRKDI